MEPLTAERLEADYGLKLAQPPLIDLATPYRLHLALIGRMPPIKVKISKRPIILQMKSITLTVFKGQIADRSPWHGMASTL